MNNQEEKNNNIEKKVSEKIKSGDIKMKSRAYFVLRTILLAVIIVILALFIIYLISFIIFSLHASGVWFLPSFGFHSIGVLFGSLPWLLVVLSIVLILALEIFAERLSFVYHRPVVYSLIFIIVAVVLASILVGMTSFHSSLFENSRDHNLPIIGQFYRGYGSPRIHNVHNGVVTGLTNNGFNIETPNGEIFNVILNSQNLSALQATIKVGDTIVVVGNKNGNNIQATDVRKIQEDANLFPSHRLRVQPLQ
jgi:hypothetical protein